MANQKVYAIVWRQDMSYASPRSPQLNIPAEAILFSLFSFRWKAGQKKPEQMVARRNL
jgi:hypothetical protein